MQRLNICRYLFVLFFSLSTISLYAQSDSNLFSLEQLMGFMSQHKEIHATFVEKKYISGVNVPVESSGELVFIAPSTMIRNTLQPQPEMFTLSDGTITMERKGKARSLQIKDYPELAIHFEGVRALLLGDLDRMTRLYKVNLTGLSADWKLELHPLEEGTALKALSLSGNQDNVLLVEVHLQDGDYSIMQISRENIVQ